MKNSISLRDFNTLKANAQAEVFLSISSREDIPEALRDLKNMNKPFCYIGGGSNILLADGINVFRYCGEETSFESDNEKRALTVGSGKNLDTLIQECISNGVYGLENLSSIPGTVGGAIVQNAGAYGVEINEFVDSVLIYDPDKGVYRELSNSECKFSYRNSTFKDNPHWVIIESKMHFPHVWSPVTTYKGITEFYEKNPDCSAQELRDEVVAMRGKKFPDMKKYGTAGCFFKNPVVPNAEYDRLNGIFSKLPSFKVGDKDTKIPAAALIERLLGYIEQRSNVWLYEKHSGIVVTDGTPDTKEIEEFVNHIWDVVHENANISLEREIVTPKEF